MRNPLPMRPLRAPAARRTLLALAALAAAYAMGQLAARHPSVEAAASARVARELRDRLGAEVSIGPDVHVDWAFRVTFGPVEVRAPGAAAASEPAVRLERVKVRASGLALLAGRVEPASIRLLGVRVEAGPRAARLRALLAPRRTPAGAERAAGGRGAGAGAERGRSRLPHLPRVHARGVVLAFELGGARLEIGPLDADLSAALRPGAERADLDVRLPGGGRAAATVFRDEDGLRLHARADHLGPGDLPGALRALPARLEAGSISLELEATARPSLERAEGRVRLAGERLSLGGERVAAEPVGPLDAELTGELRWDGAERRLSIAQGELAVAGGALRVRASGEVRIGGGLPFSATLAAHRVEYASLVAALPPALAPPPEAPRARGTFDARLEVGGPLLAPAAWRLAAALDLGRMREASRRLEPQPLRGPFVHRLPPPAGAAAARGAELVVGPANPDFVPIAELPAHVIRAVTASEDAGFFAHHGFDFAELGLAFAAGAEQGRVVRGGSTITQQVAKNLFLGREKTLARKAREATLTLALEACLQKARLLEIYLNVAEWGPGVHGVGPAARHWFGKDARALSAREAAFLATVIPNPVRFEYLRRRGLSPAWTDRVDELLLRMTEQGAISGDELVHALAEPLVFTEG